MNRHPGASASTLSGLALTLTLTLVGAETALATSAPAHATLSVSTTDTAGSIDPTNPGIELPRPAGPYAVGTQT
jgi:hypothetical protein